MENENVQPLQPFRLEDGRHYVSRGLGIVGPMVDKVFGPSTEDDGGRLFVCREGGFGRVSWRPNGLGRGSNGNSPYDLLRTHIGSLPNRTRRVGEAFDALTPGERYIDHGGYVHGPLAEEHIDGEDIFTAAESHGLVWLRSGRVRNHFERHPRDLKYRVPADWTHSRYDSRDVVPPREGGRYRTACGLEVGPMCRTSSSTHPFTAPRPAGLPNEYPNKELTWRANGYVVDEGFDDDLDLVFELVGPMAASVDAKPEAAEVRHPINEDWTAGLVNSHERKAFAGVEVPRR